MFCKKCGFNIPEGEYVCPYCNTKAKDIYRDSKDNVTNQEEMQHSKDYDPVDEYGMGIFRNKLGYIDLKTRPLHHVLIAILGYLAMNILFIIIGRMAVRFSGLDLSCMEADICSVEVKTQYNLIVAITQVVCELLVVVAAIIMFRKYFKVLLPEAKEKYTWKWFGICLAIMYGGVFIYSNFIQLLGLESTSSNQDGVNEIIFNTPFLGFLFVVIAAPIFEEVIFRFGIFRAFTFKDKKFEILGVVITTLIFAGVHMIATFEEVFKEANNPNWEVFKSDMLTLPVYLIGAFALTFAYYKSKNIVSNIALHMFYNGLSFISIILLSPMLEGTTNTIINFMTRLLF